MEDRTVLKNVPSGTIDLIFDGCQLVMQYNCDCLDALPWCKGACCRYRPFYNIGLEPEEIGKFDAIPHPEDDKVQILKHVDGHCVYLDGESSLCGVHDDKPCICKKWHCSPRGGGDEIETRDGGWVLLPLKVNPETKDDADGQ